MKKTLWFLCLIPLACFGQISVPFSPVTLGSAPSSFNPNLPLPTLTAPLNIGTPAITDTGVEIQMTGSMNGYLQAILQNTSNGTAASADYIVNNNLGTSTTFYGDFGINSSTFTGSGNFNAPNATYVYASNGDLVLGTITSNAIHFVVGGLTASDAMTIASTGLVTIAGHTVFEGVTSTGATGTGNLVYSIAPTITGHPTIEGVTSTGSTGTGNFVFSASPTLSGTVAGTYTLGGTPTINAFTLGGTIAGGGNQINNVVIGASTPLAGNFTTLGTTGLETNTITAVGTAQTIGNQITNTTAAANNSQQYSPMMVLTGQGWQTNTSGSQAFDFGIQAQPVQGAANPTGVLTFYQRVNGGGWSSLFSFSSLNSGNSNAIQPVMSKNSGGGFSFFNGNFGVMLIPSGSYISPNTDNDGSNTFGLATKRWSQGFFGPSGLVLANGTSGGATVTTTGANGSEIIKLTGGNGSVCAPVIVATGNVVGASAAGTITGGTFTVGAADGTFEVSGNLNVTAATAVSTSINCVYTDETNVSRTMIIPISGLGGTFLAGGLATSTGPFESTVMTIRCKTATTITISIAAGTFNGVTYNARAIIKQVN